MTFQLRLAVLARAGSKPIDTVSQLSSSGARRLAETWRHSLLRDPKEAVTHLAVLDLIRPFSDPALVRRAARYSEFLQEACRLVALTPDKQDAEATASALLLGKTGSSLSYSIPDVLMCCSGTSTTPPCPPRVFIQPTGGSSRG